MKLKTHQRKLKRRRGLYFLEQRVRHILGQQELIKLDIKLDIEQTHDLITALEQKVNQLLAEKRQREQEKQEQAKPANLFIRWWRKYNALMRSVVKP